MRRLVWFAALALVPAGCGAEPADAPLPTYSGSPDLAETFWVEGSLARVDDCLVLSVDGEGDDDGSVILRLPSDAGADPRWEDDRLSFHQRAYPPGSTLVFRATSADTDDVPDLPAACRETDLRYTVSAVPGTTDLAVDPSATVIGSGDQLRVPVAELSNAGMDAAMRADLAIVGGRCLGVAAPGTDTLLVWPFGTTVSYDPDPVVLLPDGTTYAVGDQLDLGGGYSYERSSDGPEPEPMTGLPEECRLLDRFLVAPV